MVINNNIEMKVFGLNIKEFYGGEMICEII
jgi:hypothetical protein